MEIINCRINDILPYENNAKKHSDEQVKKIADSIEAFGFNQPLVLDKDNVIIVGHGRYLAAKKLNLSVVPVLIVDISKEKAKAYRLADNKLNESEWDMALVIDELKELSLDMVELTGFSKEITLEPDERDNSTPENAPERVKLGDMWALGENRLICGDCTEKSVLEQIMGRQSVSLVFTSPPYNMKGEMYQNYKDDLKSEEYINFNLKVINNIKEYIDGFIFWNISYNKNARWEFLEIMYRIIKETDLKFLELIVWNKKHAMPITSKEMLTRQYEDILVIGDEDSIKQDLDLFFCGANRSVYFNKKTNKALSNYWELGVNNVQLKNHLACYPVELPLKGILLMSEEGNIVLDPFTGSGSTLIACEKSNRKFYGIELDPKYCDITIKRWEDYTGNKAEKLS